ncbi:hypothetical protein LTR85_001650 [Meristemomyces frigidus]|nr:hypothetical protein LTR85_001650 [Meristemomyces frigidus]
MANNSLDFRSVSGKMESEEPAPGSMAANNNNTTPAQSSSQRRSPSQQRQASSQSTSAPPTLRKQPSSNLVPLSSPSAGSSPQTSRNTSPIRKDSRPQSFTTPISTQPSAAAIQRALSAANVPQLPASGSVTDAVSRLPRASKSAGGGSGDTTPQWPSSPRLKSPPPSSATSSRRGSAAVQKKAEPSASAPSISVQGPPPQTSTPPAKQSTEEPRRVEQALQLQPPPKAPSRGPSGKSTLETVQENSSDSISEPLAAVQAAADLKPLTKIPEEDRPSSKKEGHDSDKHTQPGESGSESAGSKVDQRRGRRQSLTQPSKPASQPPKTNKSSYAPLTSAKSRQSEGKQNMTVETETVASIPQSALTAGDRSGSGRNEQGGSVRLKPSNETIRPKKERKKPSQKARSINQGTGTLYTPLSPLLVRRESFDQNGQYDSTASSPPSSNDVSGESSGTVRRSRLRNVSYSSPWQRVISFGKPTHYIRTLSNQYLRKASSKADLFEARVASQVDEANTSDSDETFVYESNPPETQRRPRHHSRTPSVTSSHSTADQRSGGVRNFGDVLEERRVAGKRSMKFSNNPYNELDSPDSKNGTVRSHQARHFGKFGRGGSHASMFDQDSPFTQASKLRSNHLSTRHSRPNSPRSPQSVQQQRPSGLFGRKQEHSFDFDGEGADDERTPLVGTVRTPRGTRQHRRIGSGSVRSIDEYYGVRPPPSRCCGNNNRFAGCLLGFCVLVAVILSAIAFMFMSNRPMYDVRVRKIQNVLASEQEIMLDLLVGAVNPNALGITVGEMDVNVFAKSRHVGGDPQFGHGKDVVERRRRRKRVAMEKQQGGAKDGNPNPWQDGSGHWHSPSGGVDHGTDPDPPSDDDDVERDAQTMLLGRIFHFDQALSFEGSPIKRHPHYSVGELRLMKPGNKTEAGGSARWEEVLKHEFELIVRGVLRYQLPVSMRWQSVSVGASVEVHPEDGVDEEGKMRVVPVDHGDDWWWVDWDEEEESAWPGKEKVVEVDVTPSR